ncbi:MAG: hypothetical protein MHPSP_003626, partial [Paramarteilia canceri]
EIKNLISSAVNFATTNIKSRSIYKQIEPQKDTLILEKKRFSNNGTTSFEINIHYNKDTVNPFFDDNKVDSNQEKHEICPKLLIFNDRVASGIFSIA